MRGSAVRKVWGEVWEAIVVLESAMMRQEIRVMLFSWVSGGRVVRIVGGGVGEGSSRRIAIRWVWTQPGACEAWRRKRADGVAMVWEARSLTHTATKLSACRDKVIMRQAHGTALLEWRCLFLRHECSTKKGSDPDPSTKSLYIPRHRTLTSRKSRWKLDSFFYMVFFINI
jgi:hypothetical protein